MRNVQRKKERKKPNLRTSCTTIRLYTCFRFDARVKRLTSDKKFARSRFVAHHDGWSDEERHVLLEPLPLDAVATVPDSGNQDSTAR